MLEKLWISKGDTLFATETPRGVELSPYDEEFAKQMEIAESVMRENRSLNSNPHKSRQYFLATKLSQLL